MRTRYLPLFCLLAATLAAPVFAQQPAPTQGQAPAANEPLPAPPTLPATISRNGSGQAVIRAVRLKTPLKVDGKVEIGRAHV